MLKSTTTGWWNDDPPPRRHRFLLYLVNVALFSPQPYMTYTTTTYTYSRALSSISTTLSSSSISSVVSVNSPSSHLPHTKPVYKNVAPAAPNNPPSRVKIGCNHDLGCHADPTVSATRANTAAPKYRRCCLAVRWDILVYSLRVFKADRIIIDFSLEVEVETLVASGD